MSGIRKFTVVIQQTLDAMNPPLAAISPMTDGEAGLFFLLVIVAFTAIASVIHRARNGAQAELKDRSEKKMIKKLLEKSKQPKKPIPLNVLLGCLLAQSFFMLIVLLVVVIWPERAPATFAFVFMSIGISLGLWLEIRESGVEQSIT